MVRHGETGMIYESSETFAAHLTRLIVDTPFRRRLAENARRYVAEYRLLGRHFRHREIWYRSMLERLPELNRELREQGCRVCFRPEQLHAKGSPGLNSRWCPQPMLRAGGKNGNYRSRWQEGGDHRRESVVQTGVAANLGRQPDLPARGSHSRARLVGVRPVRTTCSRTWSPLIRSRDRVRPPSLLILHASRPLGIVAPCHRCTLRTPRACICGQLSRR